MTDKELNGFSLSISETDTYKKATGAHEFEVEGKLDFFTSYRVTARGKGVWVLEIDRWCLTETSLPANRNKYRLLTGTF